MTGGMGVIAPVPHITSEDIDRLGNVFIRPFVEALRDKGRPFKGVMYPSIKLTAKGPKLLEINARLGDPEAPAVLSLLKSDFLELVLACEQGRLDEIPATK
jgi:phosphoribosylamine--glycine ligase